MSSKKNKPIVIDTRAAMRKSTWEASVAEMREGRRQRAVTFTDRKKQASRMACRGRFI